MEAGMARPAAIGIGLACVIGLGILAVWGLAPGAQPPTPPGLTEVTDSGELKGVIHMDRPSILTSTNYLGHRVYTVKATLKNVSNMPIRMVDVKMTFLDYDKKPIHEEVRSAFDSRQRPLEPGTEYRFEIAFENPPQTWNYRVPETHVVRAAY
jgi:hypothetical protein